MMPKRSKSAPPLLIYRRFFFTLIEDNILGYVNYIQSFSIACNKMNFNLSSKGCMQVLSDLVAMGSVYVVFF